MTEPTPETQIKANKEAAIAEMVTTIIESLTNKPEEWRFDGETATHASEVVIAFDGSNVIKPRMNEGLSVRAMNNITSAIATAQAKQATLALTTGLTLLVEPDGPQTAHDYLVAEAQRHITS